MKYTVITKETGILTKQLSLDENGKLVKDASQCRMSSGTAIQRESSIEEFAEYLKEIRNNGINNIALVHGVNGNGTSKITSKKLFNNQPLTITRSKDYFHYPDGNWIAMFDHDVAPDQKIISDYD